MAASVENLPVKVGLSLPQDLLLESKQNKIHIRFCYSRMIQALTDNKPSALATCLTAARLVRVPRLLLSVMTMA